MVFIVECVWLWNFSIFFDWYLVASFEARIVLIKSNNLIFDYYHVYS